MARMIPPVIAPEVKSPGEREIFRRLQEDPGTANWIVLHSLDVAEHLRQVAGEVDFVVIIPGRGVLCLEVKAVTSVRREDGMWYLGSKAERETRGPFRQASEAMHSIRKRLISRHPELAHVVFWSTVVFPYVDFTISSNEWHPWQVIDRRAFQSHPIATLLLNVLDHARHFLSTRPHAGWFDATSGEPTPQQCLVIADVLRPDFEFFESPRVRGDRLAQELLRYTGEQIQALDTMDANPRVIFAGPAGTGKTLLAIEAARRGHAAGRRVLLVCFNRLLGRWLEEQTADLRPLVVTRTLHSQMLAVWQGSVPPDAGQTFWQTELPLHATLALIEDEAEMQRFDELVIDEAQDMLRDDYLDFLDQSLRGGFAAGRWRMFGDFEKQVIFDAANRSLNDFQQQRSGYAPIYSLRINCRNPPRVSSLVHALGGLQPGYTRTLRPDNGIEPELRRYRSPADQRELLVQVLGELEHDHIRGQDIVILSPRAETACAATIIQQPWKDRLCPIDRARGGQIRYGAIQAFKGLEAPVVILTDIDRVNDASATDLFYVAITRSLDRLIILIDARIAREMARLSLSGTA